MKTPQPTDLAVALREYFGDQLPRARGMSTHTLHSYRDSLKLLLRFLLEQTKKDPLRLEIEDVSPQQVCAFLEHIESTRHNLPVTRNVRLAAIHSFFRFLAGRYPERLELCQRILSVPFKRTTMRSVDYLEFAEINAVLASVDRDSADGRRDYALLATMFNTGCRAQEILDLRPCDLQLDKPCHARLFGKGRKERICPLWLQTADLLKALITERKVQLTSHDPLFRNHKGNPLTRFGIRYLLSKYFNLARSQAPTLVTKRLHPHSMRHSTAVHLLQSGVDMVTISHWLGHVSVNTTNRYATVNLEMKREAIKKAEPAGRNNRGSSWRRNQSLIAWLEAL